MNTGNGLVRAFVAHQRRLIYSTRRLLEQEEKIQKKGFLYRMAPPKGGTDPPDAKFMVIATIVLGAGYYSWFIHEDDTRSNEGGKA